jgi:ribosome-associated protein
MPQGAQIPVSCPAGKWKEWNMQRLEFVLDREFVELNQLLKLSGLCDSGGAGKMLVADGAVKVDGKLESRKTAKIRAGQVVRIGDVQVKVVKQA